MKAGLALALVALALLDLSCIENVTAPVAQKGFSVKLKVRTLGGTPVGGLRVSAWNHLSVPIETQSPIAASKRESSLPTPTVAFEFGLASVSNVTFSILELNDSLVSTPINRIMAAGLYLLDWQVEQPVVPTRVYKYHIVAKDTLHGSVLFEDMKYAVLWQPDPSLSILGWTSSQGEYQTHDSLLFPNVFSLPPLVLTNASGPDSLDTFTIRDTVTIVLTDTSTSREMEFTEVINKGVENDINLTWELTSAKPASREHVKLLMTDRELAVRDSVVSVLPSWKLYQSYPNPFN